MIFIQGNIEKNLSRPSCVLKILFLFFILITSCHQIRAKTVKKPFLRLSTSSLCPVDDGVTNFLTNFIRQEFPQINVNIIYDSPDTHCERTRQIFHDNLSKLTTTTISFYNPRTKYDHDLIGFHPHQLEHWPELNLVILFDGKFANETLEKLVKLYHFKRQNSFTIFWQRDNRMENLLEISALSRLKYKIELCTTIMNQSMMELEIKSRCFYCDDGAPETQTITTINLHTGENIVKEKKKKNGVWLEEGEIPKRSDLFKDYTKNFYGKVLQVSLAKGIPAMMNFKILKNGRIETSGGFQNQLFHLIQRKLNFAYNITVHSTFGLEGPNGIFSGMVGAVQTGKADLGVGAAFTHSRCRVAHYLTPNTFHLVTFITANSQPRPEWENIFLAFNLTPTWVIVLCTAVFLVYPTFILGNIFYPPSKQGQRESKEKMSHILTSGFGFLVRSILEQKWGKSIVRYNSLKILALAWLIGMLVVRIEFKCNLMKLTVSPPMESLPTTFSQLANSDYDIYTHYAGGSLDRIVRTTHSPTFDKIAMKMKKETSIKKCLGETLKGKTACISYEDDAIIEGHRHYSDPHGHVFVHRAPVSAFNFFAGVILPKEAVYIDSMESTVGHIVDMGITKKFHDEQYQDVKVKGQRWAKQRKDKTFVYYETGHHYEKLVMSHFLVPVFILLVGSLVASIVWVFETKKQIKIPNFQFKISFKTKSTVVAHALIPKRIRVRPARIKPDRPKYEIMNKD